MSQQQQSYVQLPVDQVKEIERNIVAANCVRYFEIRKETRQNSKIQFLSSCVESQFLSCLGRYPFGFLLFVFLFFIYFHLFLFFPLFF